MYDSWGKIISIKDEMDILSTAVGGLVLGVGFGMEQYYIIKENTKNYLNKINGISPNNGSVGLYMNEGAKAIIRSFGNIVEDEILYWYKK